VLPFRVTDLQSKRGKGWGDGAHRAQRYRLAYSLERGRRSCPGEARSFGLSGLHRTAHRYMARERSSHILQTTALINEVYMRLVDFQAMNWQNRNHFFGICANLMRRVLTDFARSRRFLKRGGNAIHVTFDEGLFGGQERAAGIVALDDALNALAVLDERKSRVWNCGFLAG